MSTSTASARAPLPPAFAKAIASLPPLPAHEQRLLDALLLMDQLADALRAIRDQPGGCSVYDYAPGFRDVQGFLWELEHVRDDWATNGPVSGRYDAVRGDPYFLAIDLHQAGLPVPPSVRRAAGQLFEALVANAAGVGSQRNANVATS